MSRNAVIAIVGAVALVVLVGFLSMGAGVGGGMMGGMGPGVCPM